MGLREKYLESRRKFSLIPLEALTRPHTYVYSHDENGTGCQNKMLEKCSH